MVLHVEIGCEEKLTVISRNLYSHFFETVCLLLPLYVFFLSLSSTLKSTYLDMNIFISHLLFLREDRKLYVFSLASFDILYGAFR